MDLWNFMCEFEFFIIYYHGFFFCKHSLSVFAIEKKLRLLIITSFIIILYIIIRISLQPSPAFQLLVFGNNKISVYVMAGVVVKVNSRCFCDGFYGTVRYIGEVPPSNGK